MNPLPSATSPLRRYLGLGLSVVALGVTGLSAMLWTSRAQIPVAQASTSDARAWMLLERSLRADARTPLAARVQTVVFAGERQVQSEAQLWRAPGQVAISYLSGPMRGQGSGYSKRWFWRQEEGGPLQAYAEVAQAPDAMGRARFELMRQNYLARLQAPQQLNGRAVEVIELRPRQPASGAHGPARRVFIDAQTGLTLRTEAFNYRLQPVSHSTFSRLDLSAPATAKFEPPAAIFAAAKSSFWQGEELGQNEAAVERKTGLAPPQSDHLPPGFTVDGMGVHRCLKSVPGLQVSAFTRYTDGINELTLFAVKAVPSSFPNAPSVEPVDAKVAQLNCNFGPATVISRPDGPGTLVAMGDLPVAVLRRALDDAQFRAVAQPTPAPRATATVVPGSP